MENEDERHIEKDVKLVDIISHLPDDIISRVLSFLETKEAIRTCVLSSRWRNLWKGITCIQLRGYDTDPEKFSNLVDHVLVNISSTNYLVFELDCPTSIDLARLNDWIGRLVSHKIERLILHANNSDSFVLPELPLPQFILSFTTLKYLNLDCFGFEISESVVCFPCLKTLDLHVVIPESLANLNKLLSSCPVVEEIDLVGYLAFEDDNHEQLKIDVSISTLRRFSVEVRIVEGIDFKKLDVIIDTPNLEYLFIYDDSYTNYVVKNLSLISNVIVRHVEVCSDLGPKLINSFVELLKGISSTALLALEASTIGVLTLALSYTWPTFPYLKALIVHLNELSTWTCLFKVLHCAPFLNILILDLGLHLDVDDDDALFQWTKPNTIPKCLLEHVKIIGIQEFRGLKDQVELVEFLLNNGKELECMIIGYNNRSEEVTQKLLMSPRASKSCEVDIYNRIYFPTSHAEINDIHNWI